MRLLVKFVLHASIGLRVVCDDYVSVGIKISSQTKQVDHRDMRTPQAEVVIRVRLFAGGFGNKAEFGAADLGSDAH